MIFTDSDKKEASVSTISVVSRLGMRSKSRLEDLWSIGYYDARELSKGVLFEKLYVECVYDYSEGMQWKQARQQLILKALFPEIPEEMTIKVDRIANESLPVPM